MWKKEDDGIERRLNNFRNSWLRGYDPVGTTEKKRMKIKSAPSQPGEALHSKGGKKERKRRLQYLRFTGADPSRSAKEG